MKLIVGLGNPGAQYAGTRHNVGFDVISDLCQRWQVGKSQLKYQSEMWESFQGGQKVLLVAPQTYMNRSGESVQQIARFFQVPSEQVLVICDDMNLPVGQLRWRAAGSAGGQKGLADIILRLATEQVPRLRIGVGRPPGRMDASSWVLGRFRPDEQDVIGVALKRAADSVETAVCESVVAAMNKYNRADEG
ncbi:MAG: aminoacyl-tRNA hydrolase [Planctomycetaceae bacterium]|nr:aminoacyl-tRNA hydrolase [Planctomycetaceae bacterium]